MSPFRRRRGADEPATNKAEELNVVVGRPRRGVGVADHDQCLGAVQRARGTMQPCMFASEAKNRKRFIGSIDRLISRSARIRFHPPSIAGAGRRSRRSSEHLKKSAHREKYPAGHMQRVGMAVALFWIGSTSSMHADSFGRPDHTPSICVGVSKTPKMTNEPFSSTTTQHPNFDHVVYITPQDPKAKSDERRAADERRGWRFPPRCVRCVIRTMGYMAHLCINRKALKGVVGRDRPRPNLGRIQVSGGCLREGDMKPAARGRDGLADPTHDCMIHPHPHRQATDTPMAPRRLPLPLLPLLLLALLLLLVLRPPPAAAQHSQQQPQGIEAWYRFPLCLQSAGNECLDPSSSADTPFFGGGFIHDGGSSSQALSAPGAGAVLSVGWDPAREGYVLWRQQAGGAHPEGARLLLLANATAVEGAVRHRRWVWAMCVSV